LRILYLFSWTLVPELLLRVNSSQKKGIRFSSGKTGEAHMRTMKFTSLLLTFALALCGASFGQRAQAVQITNGPRVEGTGDNFAVIAWTTNTGGSSIVRYGTDRNNLNQTAEAPYADNEGANRQTHRVHLKNLQPNTTYYYMVDSGQGEGTGTEAKSGIEEFHTQGTGSASAGGVGQERAQALRIINGPRVEGTGDSWAVIAWTTNTGGSSILRYGTDRNNLNETAEAPYADNEGTQKQTHRVHLKNLKPNTTYYYMVDSGQGEGTGTEAKSGIEEFHTK
jgi:phosphodiesterase/alkaline phosphatase D-like protein